MIQAVVLNRKLEFVEYVEDRVNNVIWTKNFIIVPLRMWEDLVAGNDISLYDNEMDWFNEWRETNHRSNLVYLLLIFKLDVMVRVLPRELVWIVGSYLYRRHTT